MKQIIFFLLNISLIFSFAHAADKSKPVDSEAPVQNLTSIITGKIQDKNSGEALAGVLVCIEGTKEQCYTDFEGNFLFNKVKPGEYKLNVALISYRQLEIEKLNIGSKEAHELTIHLEQAK